MTEGTNTHDDDPVIARKNEILRQMGEADEVRGRDAVCSEFGISIDEFNEIFIIYRMTLETLGYNEDAVFDQIGLDEGVLSEDDIALSKTNEHQWVLNRIRMRLAMGRKSAQVNRKLKP